MAFSTFNLSFGKKVLLLAVGLVAVAQAGTLVPVLGAIRADAERTADRSVRLAGIVFEEFMRNRMAQLETTVEVLAADFPFRDAIATHDAATIAEVLANHAARAGTTAAAVFDLEGSVLASTGLSPRMSFAPLAPRLAAEDDANSVLHGIVFADGAPFQTVTVPVRAPVTIAWVMLAFPLAEEFVAGLERLTDLEISIVGFGIEGVRVYASTLPSTEAEAALGEIRLGDRPRDAAQIGGSYITGLRPILDDVSGPYVALQLPMASVVSAYERIRDPLVVTAAVALLLAFGGAAWVSGMVSSPLLKLADAARRMREGIYSEPINVAATDEFGELAAGFNAMQEAIANRERDIFHIAHHDSLSGLPTRDVIVGDLRDLIETSERLAVIDVAIERFHEIASTLGHGTADQVIARAAETLRTLVGDSVRLGHVAQHEFVLVVPDADADRAVALITRIREKLRAGIDLPSANISLQVSGGIALYPEHRRDAPELLRCAMIARANIRQHIMGVGVYEPAHDERAQRLVRIVGDLPAALQKRELEVVYQPKMDVATGEVVGAEALVRWNHPELGMLPPIEFVTAIEQAGGIAHLTRYVLAEATAQCAAWQAEGLDVPMSMNISVDDLEDEYLPYYLLELTSKWSLKPQLLTLEVTESAIMHNIETSLAVIQCMRELGFRLAIDDFGTGQASLTQLKRIPADELKIDKSFVSNLAHPHDEAIVRAAIELAHQFGLEAVAEGVEDAACLDRLRALGCETAQGFYFARPLAAGTFAEWLRGRRQGSESGLVRLLGARA